MSDLRERRRQEMSNSIHKATVELAYQEGFDIVTTQAISKHVGISHRTFFNYYENKESALVGERASVSEQSAQTFIENKAPIGESIRQLLFEFSQTTTEKREELILILEIVNTHPKVGQIQLARMAEHRNHMSQLLGKRLTGRSELMLDILADTILYSGWTAILRWLKEDIEFETSFNDSWQALCESIDILKE